MDRNAGVACAYGAVVEAVLAVGHVGNRARGALGKGVADPVTSGSLAPYLGGVGWLAQMMHLVRGRGCACSPSRSKTKTWLL